uniref:Seipin n=1 Tax=Clastoptera arizonana TaxID=38151 RepID=A0A1B6CYY4_9HEMI
MVNLVSFILSTILKMRLFRFISRKIYNFKRKTLDSIEIVWDNIFKGWMFALIVISVIWLSIFAYIVFYYMYVPSLSHNRPVYLEFDSCGTKAGICSYPTAHIELTKKQHLLMVGQPYKIFLTLEMPESPSNVNLGMFMVCTFLKDKRGKLVSRSCRSTMLHYQSWLLKIANILVYAPLYIFGSKEEVQTLTVEMYSDFEDVQNHAVTDIYVEIQTQHIELYKAKLYIQAQLSGLRHLMFHWPLSSAFIGVSSNLFVIIFIATLSWWHLYGRHEFVLNPIIALLRKFIPSFGSKASFQVEEVGSQDMRIGQSPFDTSEGSDSDNPQQFFKEATSEDLEYYLEVENDS